MSVLWLAGCAAYNMRCDYYHGANPPQCGKYNPEPVPPIYVNGKPMPRRD